MQGSNGATTSLHIDRRYTSLELISHRDTCPNANHNNVPALLVWGGARVVKTACVGQLMVQGDAVIEGNLVVLGKCFTEASEIVTIADRNICLGNVIGMPADDYTANTGGILVKSTPGNTKSWVWLNDIGTGGAGAWNANQDINLGVGRVDRDGTATCPGCGPDTALRGTAYRIDDFPVLTLTDLGDTVVNSSLETVGTLYKGAINNAFYVQSSAPIGPSLTSITTTQPNGLMVGDQVLISATDSSPVLDGCHIVTAVLTSTTFRVAQTTFSAATTGFVKGPTFPIDIGTSPIWSGTHTVNCGNDLIVNNASAQLPVFTMNGTTEQLDLVGAASQSHTERISTVYNSTFSGTQRSLWVQNETQSTTLSSVSAGVDIEQTYTGTNTFFVDAEMTVHSVGERITMDTNFRTPTPRISARGIDVTSNSPNNKGSNVGVYAEAGGSVLSEHAAGVIGFTNPKPLTGLFSTGVMGCANKTRQDIANTIAAQSLLGTSTGGFFCNPETGPNEYAIVVEGESYNNGNVIITGDLTVFGNVNFAGNTTNPAVCIPILRTNEMTTCGVGGTAIQVDVNLIPSGTHSLGDPTHYWGNAYIDHITTTGNVDIGGKLTANEFCVLGDSHLMGNLIIDGNLFVTTIGPPIGGGSFTVGCTTYYHINVQTIGATTVNAITVPMLGDRVCMVETKLLVTNATLAYNAKAFNKKLAYYNTGGTLTAMGTATEPDTWATGTGTTTWKCNYTTLGTNLTVSVTGEVGKTLNWQVCVQANCL